MIIAHRLSTVERADRIIVINSGSVIEQGRHSELIRRTGGLYSKLVQRQMLAADVDLEDEMAHCDSDYPTDSASCLPAVSSSLAVAISTRSSEYSNCTIKLSLPSLVGTPVSDSTKNGSPKYGSIA